MACFRGDAAVGQFAVGIGTDLPAQEQQLTDLDGF